MSGLRRILESIPRRAAPQKMLRLAALGACLAGLSWPALSNPFEYKLANGLRVIVKEDRRAPG